MNPLMTQGVNAGIGILTGAIEDNRHFNMQKKLNAQQVENSRKLMNYQQIKQLEMWEKTGYGAQTEQMKKAGLNPALMYGMSGGGGQTTGNISATGQGGQARQEGTIIPAMSMGIQQQLIEVQKDLIKAQIPKTNEETKNIAADTENKILQQVVTKYMGKEAKDTYEQITSPNRQIQAQTYEEELRARNGIAGTIYELWHNGQLIEKSVAEIEQILLQNEKLKGETRNIIKTMDLIEANIKGVKLDNIIKDLETRLQTETGIDRNAPAWLKILGRLFVQLIGSK